MKEDCGESRCARVPRRSTIPSLETGGANERGIPGCCHGMEPVGTVCQVLYLRSDRRRRLHSRAVSQLRRPWRESTFPAVALPVTVAPSTSRHDWYKSRIPTRSSCRGISRRCCSPIPIRRLPTRLPAMRTLKLTVAPVLKIMNAQRDGDLRRHRPRQAARRRLVRRPRACRMPISTKNYIPLGVAGWASPILPARPIPDIAPTLYTDVVAQHCRACHTSSDFLAGIIPSFETLRLVPRQHQYYPAARCPRKASCRSPG